MAVRNRMRRGKNIDSGLIISDDLSVTGLLSSSSSRASKCKVGSDRGERRSEERAGSKKQSVIHACVHVDTIISPTGFAPNVILREEKNLPAAFREAAFKIRLHRFKKDTQKQESYL